MKKVILILFILYLFAITAFAGDTDMYLMANDDAKLFTATIETVNENMVQLKVVCKIKGNITENELLKIPYFEYNSRKDKVLEPDDSCFIAMVGQKFFFSIETTSTDPKTLKFINHLTNKSMNMEGQSIDECIEKLINDGSYEEAEKKRLSKASIDMTTSDENVKKTESSKRNPQPMQLIILFTSLIPVLLFIVIGFLIKFKKAYWLISGYNMMSKEKKKNVDIENLGKFTANVCFVIAAILLAAGIAISLNLAVVSGIIVFLLIPVIIYTLIHAQKYDGNTLNAQGKMKPRTKLLIGSIIGFLLLITAGVMLLLYFGNLPSQYVINNGIFEISGMYGKKINIKDISNLELKDTFPEVLYRSNGSAIGNKLRGNFKIKDIGQAKLFVDADKPPFIFLTANSQIFIFNCQESIKTKELFESLKNERQTSVASPITDSYTHCLGIKKQEIDVYFKILLREDEKICQSN